MIMNWAPNLIPPKVKFMIERQDLAADDCCLLISSFFCVSTTLTFCFELLVFKLLKLFKAMLSLKRTGSREWSENWE